MIQKRHIAPLLAGLMLLAACNKEQEPVLADTDGVPAGHLKLSVESPRPADGSKQLLDGLNTYWKNGDRVYVNGVESRVRIASTETYIENYIPAPAENEYYIAGTFPFFSDQNGTANTDYTISSSYGKSLFFDCPASYNYSVTSDGKVDLGNIPMVAVAERTASELTFKHLTATINVNITNNSNARFVVSGVEITSDNAMLSGNKEIFVSRNNMVTVNPTTTNTDSQKKVTINFTSTPTNEKTIAGGQSMNVPVPILPVASAKTLTFSVNGTLFRDGTNNNGETKTFTKTITLNRHIKRNDYLNGVFTQEFFLDLNTGEGFSNGGSSTI